MVKHRDSKVYEVLRRGTVIPAHPLALTPNRRLDERRQKALTRYYIAAGAGGLAVGVHTTQFAIREPRVGLFEPVLKLAVEEMDRADQVRDEPLIRIGGICGDTSQALREARLLADLGYHAGLLSLAALRNADDHELIAHCKRVAEILPLVGFYLQPAVGGRVLPYFFWRQFAEIENVVAIKIAPFNRYQTLDVVRAVADSGRDVPQSCWKSVTPPFAKRTAFRKTSSKKARRLPIAMPLSSTPHTTLRAASPACRKSCAARDCWKASGASIPRKP